MKFSVLIANYNNARFLKTALDSVINQSYKNWEIILIDDGSTDNFQEIIGDYLDEERLLIFSNKVNMGCGFTKHRCTTLAGGDILGFLDPDDKLEENALLRLVDAHVNFPEASIVHSTHFVCDENLVIDRVAEYVKELPPNIPYLLLNDGRIHHFASFKKSSYSKTVGIDVKLKKAVDQDLYYKLEEVGEIKFIPEPLYHYRIHPGGISTMGKEREASILHYEIVRRQCIKRIQDINKSNTKNPKLKRAYRARYHKISAFYWSRKKNWVRCIAHLLVFPFVGGGQNLLSYLKKLPVEGRGLLRKSFTTDYQIKQKTIP